MNRTHKWRYKRLEMQTEKERLMNSLLSVSENLMKFHSELLANASRESFDRMFDNPIAQLDEIFKIGEQKC